MTDRRDGKPRAVVDLVPPPHDASERRDDAEISPLPVAVEMVGVELSGDEDWVSTLPDPHDATVLETP